MKTLKTVFFNIIGIFVLLFLINTSFIVLTEMKKWGKPRLKKVFDPPFYKSNSELGNHTHPYTSSTGTATYGGRILYKVEYKFDQYGRRTHPPINPKPRKFAIFFGGSNTFGEGLSDKETLPYLFEKKNPQFHSYNYAFPGWAPNSHLRQLQAFNIPGQVQEKQGLVIYQYFHYHLRRVLGTAGYFSWSNGKSPHYRLADGQLKHLGLFYRSRPFYVFSLKILYLGVLKHFQKDIPSFKSNYSMDLNCAVIREIKKLVEHQFPGSDFVVLIGLKSPGEDPFIERCFVRNAITFIDARLDDNSRWKTPCPDCKNLPDPLVLHGKDFKNKLKIMPEIENHYSVLANEILADRLSHWLSEKNQPKSIDKDQNPD